MNAPQEQTHEKSSIFKERTSDFLLTKNALFECPLFENHPNAKTTIWFIRIYENFMVISQVLQYLS